MSKKVRLPTILALMLSVLSSAWSADPDTRQFDIEVNRRTVREVLNELSKQMRLQVLFIGADEFYSVQLGPLKGRYTVDDALTQLLYQSGLTYRRVNDSTIAVAPVEETRQSTTPENLSD